MIWDHFSESKYSKVLRIVKKSRKRKRFFFTGLCSILVGFLFWDFANKYPEIRIMDWLLLALGAICIIGAILNKLIFIIRLSGGPSRAEYRSATLLGKSDDKDHVKEMRVKVRSDADKLMYVKASSQAYSASIMGTDVVLVDLIGAKGKYQDTCYVMTADEMDFHSDYTTNADIIFSDPSGGLFYGTDQNSTAAESPFGSYNTGESNDSPIPFTGDLNSPFADFNGGNTPSPAPQPTAVNKPSARNYSFADSKSDESQIFHPLLPEERKFINSFYNKRIAKNVLLTLLSIAVGAGLYFYVFITDMTFFQDGPDNIQREILVPVSVGIIMLSVIFAVINIILMTISSKNKREATDESSVCSLLALNDVDRRHYSSGNAMHEEFYYIFEQPVSEKRITVQSNKKINFNNKKNAYIVHVRETGKKIIFPA